MHNFYLLKQVQLYMEQNSAKLAIFISFACRVSKQKVVAPKVEKMITIYNQLQILKHIYIILLFGLELKELC